VTLYKELQNPALVQAFAHPLRTRMLSILQEREASPKELAAEFGIPLANVAYHIQVLRKLKLIKLVKKTPRRGAVEHHYRADSGAHIDNEVWSATPPVIKRSMVGALLGEVGNDATTAAATGGFDHSDAVLARAKYVLDKEAWEELSAMLAKVLERGYELQKEAEKRLKASGHEGERRAGLGLLLFESSPSVPGADAAKTAGGSRTSSSSGRRRTAPSHVTG
jgi:DNA-binding transcriptional ArsR family regulator